MSDAPDTLQIGTILLTLFGGLALFLYGMEQMTDALKMVAGGRMKQLLARLTTNRFKAAFAGAFITSVIQSSSVTTVLVVGFISAGLMTLAQSIGVIMGANIGTTITAQIVAFKVTQYALLLVAGGFALLFFSKQEKIRQYGAMVMGLGLIFFGMELMSDATRPLRSYQPFIDLMRRMETPLLGIIIGAIFTGVIQSSSATTGVVIVLATQGFITLEAGIALALGANLGTCVTAMLAAIGKPPEAVQAALVHVFFNVLGILVWAGFIEQLAWLARWLSPAASPELSQTARLGLETPRQIANAHTVFNVANTFIFIWFAHPLARLVRKIAPERAESEPDLIRPKYLDDNLLTTPELALDRTRLELERLGRYVLQMVEQALPTVFSGSQADLTRLARMDDQVDALHRAIVTYLGQLSQENLLSSDSKKLADYMAIANHLENIGDMVETNLVETGSQRLENQVQVSQSTQQILRRLHRKVYQTVEQALSALANEDQDLAEAVMAAKLEVNQLAAAAQSHLAQRLAAPAPNRAAAFRLESDLIEYFKRVYYFAKRIAKIIADVDDTYRVVIDGEPVYDTLEFERTRETAPR